jgi:AcrR family transcriptional regulator
MIERETRRAAALAAMADHLLANGLRSASLRPLAAAAGTSDRMLLYYFADKDELLTATLAEVARRMLPLLEAAIDRTPRTADALLARIGAAVRRPAIKPFMQLWLEIAAAAGRGEQPYLAVAGQIADGFLAWIDARLRVDDGTDRAMAAARLLALVDGASLLDAVGRGRLAAAALRS